jgi:hypothetical protein
MATLTAGDAERVLRFVAEATQVDGGEPFTKEVLVELRKLVPADWVTYCEQDRVRQRVRHEIGIPDSDAAEVAYWDISTEHPVCRHHNTGDFRALKLSDFVTLAELHKSHVYDVWFRPWGVEHELNVAIPSPPWHTKHSCSTAASAGTARTATSASSTRSSRISQTSGMPRARADALRQLWPP